MSNSPTIDRCEALETEVQCSQLAAWRTTEATEDIAIWTERDTYVDVIGGLLLLLAAIFARKTFNATKEQAAAARLQADEAKAQRRLAERVSVEQIAAANRQARAAELSMETAHQAAAKQIAAAERQATAAERLLRMQINHQSHDAAAQALQTRPRLEITGATVDCSKESVSTELSYKVVGKLPIFQLVVAAAFKLTPKDSATAAPPTRFSTNFKGAQHYTLSAEEENRLSFEFDRQIDFGIDDLEQNFLELWIRVIWQDSLSWKILEMHQLFSGNLGDDITNLSYPPSHLISYRAFDPSQPRPELIETISPGAPYVTPPPIR